MNNDFKLGVLCYLPPPSIGHTLSFLKNIKNFPPQNPIVLYSDFDYSKEFEGAIKLAASPEIAKTGDKRTAIQNLAFFIGIRIAASRRFTHVLIIEPDCRVNCSGFDDLLWNEFLSQNPEAIAAGSIVFFNPCSYNQVAARKYEEFVFKHHRTKPMPFAMTGSSNLAEKRDSCVFPNGAFAIYRVEWLLKTFPEIIGTPEQYVDLSKRCKTYDYEIGVRLWNEFKENTYDKLVHLEKVYSSYGDILSSEDERKQLLIDEKVVGVHQIKSDWAGTEPKPIVDFVPVTKPDEIQPKVQLFYVSYAKDFQYLQYSLKSVKKFATGFSGVTILVPTKDVKELRALIDEIGISVNVKSGYEWSKKGFLWHEAMICRSDEWCPAADYICHFDPDCIFTKPVTPDTFFREGKPLLRYEPFESLAKRHPNTWQWKISCENALPFSCPDEGMRGHPNCYHRALYAKTRELVEAKTKMQFNDYVKSCKNEYPQNFAEFPTLSAVALNLFRELYWTMDCSRQLNPDLSPYPVTQFWSHSPPDKEQEIWIDGRQQKIIPIKIIEEILK